MNFTFDDEQLRFRDGLRALLDKECTPELVRGLWETETGRSPELWATLAEFGVTGILVPEAHGGLGLDETDLVLLMEEAGAAALPAPLMETAAVAAPLLRELGDEELAGRWLPRIAGGEAVVALGHAANGFVADAHVADLILLGSGDELHAVERGRVGLVAHKTGDPSGRAFSVDWQPGDGTRVAAGAEGRRLLAAAFDRAALFSAAQLVGAGQRLVEKAVAYACERQQFGRPIGSFQAVKHMLADVAVRLEFARPVVYRAAFSIARAAPERSRDVSHAKAAAAEAARAAARTALQVHGAIGYTWELDLHIWMKKVWALDSCWGNASWHRARLAGMLLDSDPTTEEAAA